MMKRFGLFFVCIIVGLASYASDSIFTYHLFTHGAHSLPYRRAEIGGEASAAPILVLYLHGGTSRGNDNTSQLKELAVNEIRNYLVERQIAATMIVPQCPAGGGWTGQLCVVVNMLMQQYATDNVHNPNCVYVMGGSMGGTGTWAQVSKFPGFYAAAMPVAGNPTGMVAENVAHTPILTIMGTDDRLMSIAAVEQFRNEVVEAGGTLQLEVEQGWSHAYTCEHSYTASRLDWLFAHVRGEAASINNVGVGYLQNSYMYDLGGRRVGSDHRGIVICNGKKLFVR